MMEHANRKKSNCHKPDMGLDVTSRNVKQETPNTEYGKSEEESNMAAPTLEETGRYGNVRSRSRTGR